MKKEEQLFNVDKAFCELSQKSKEMAWLKYLDKDAIMGTKLHEPYIYGNKRIQRILEIIYSLHNLSFSWEPLHAFISDDETLGITTGTYYRSYSLNDKVLIEKGKYMTVWKKKGHEWRIVFDMGN